MKYYKYFLRLNNNKDSEELSIMKYMNITYDMLKFLELDKKFKKRLIKNYKYVYENSERNTQKQYIEDYKCVIKMM